MIAKGATGLACDRQSYGVQIDGGTHLVGRAVIIATGAQYPRPPLERCVVLDDKGFIKTGPDLSQDDLTSAAWPLTRPPYLLETSRPGVFAVGDVRGGNIKRVALLSARDQSPWHWFIRSFSNRECQ